MQKANQKHVQDFRTHNPYQYDSSTVCNNDEQEEFNPSNLEGLETDLNSQ